MMQQAPAIEENFKQNLHIRPNLAGFGFHVITINPWFVTSYDHLEHIWLVVDRVQQLFSNVTVIHAVFVWTKAILVWMTRCPSHVQIQWYKPIDMFRSSSTSLTVIRRLPILFSSLHQYFRLMLTCSGVWYAFRRSHPLGPLGTLCTTDKRCFSPR